MNLPNKLTVLRMLIVPVMVFCMLSNNVSVNPIWLITTRWLALLLFIFASITDAFDGYYARKYNLVTNFGKLMDPLADKLLVLSAFVAMQELDLFPAWLVIIVLCRELLVTSLRMIGVTQNRVIQADNWGKNKTISQMIVIICAMLLLALQNTFQYFGMWEGPVREWHIYGGWLVKILIVYALIATVLSGYFYVSKNIDLLIDAN